MIAWQDFLELNRKSCEELSEQFDLGPAVSCTRTFTILPLRYAVVGGNPGQRKRLPDLAEHLRQPQQVAELKHAAYAIRPLREGFLYVMEQRTSTGRATLHRPYRIAANGSLSLTEPDAPWEPPPALGVRDVLSNIAWAFNVHDLDDLQALRLFYSPDPLTVAAQQQLLRRRHSLPAVNIARFTGAACPTPEPHVLTHDQLEQVADFAAEYDPQLRTLLQRQLFSTPSVLSLAGVRQMLRPMADPLKPRGIALVVEDAIGITQELNAWRNAGLEHLKDWLETTEPAGPDGKPGPSNERKTLVAQAFTELHQQFSERKVAALMGRHAETLRVQLKDSDQALLPGMNREGWNQFKDSLIDINSELVRQDLQARAEQGEFAKQFEQRYLPRVNLGGMRVQLGWFRQESEEAQRLAEARADDHLGWLLSPTLLEALAYYDDNDLNSGLCFAHQSGLCVIGMEAVPAGARLLAQWWQAEEMTPANLALRSFVFNQRDIAQVLEQTRLKLANLHAPADPWQMLDTTLKQAKELAAQFSRVDGHLDQLAEHSQINTAGALAWLGQLGRESLQAGMPNSSDHRLHRRLTAYLVASLGEQALNLRLAEHALDGRAPSPGRVAAPIVRRLEQAYVDSVRAAQSNAFYRLRVASGLLLLEASLLLLQGQRDNKDRRFWSEVAAAGLTSAAAGMELLAVGTEQALATVGQGSAAARGAQVSLGRFRLWGAGMAAAGGVVSIYWDFADAKTNFDQAKARGDRSTRLGTAYSLRALATGALVIGQGGVAFSQAGMYFQWLSLKPGYAQLRSILLELSYLSNRLAANRTLMLLLSRAGWIGGAIALSATLYLLLVDDNALEQWCDKCCFSLKHSGARYNSDKDEISSLLNAISEAL